MRWPALVYPAILFGTAIISVSLAAFLLGRRETPAVKPFILLLVALAQWAFFYALEVIAPTLASKVLWAKLQYPAIVSVPALWLGFVLHYTGQKQRLINRSFLALAAVSLITVLLTWTNELHGLMWSRTALVQHSSLLLLDVFYGPWFWVHVAYSYLALAIGMGLLVRFVISSWTLYRQQALMLLLGALLPWVANTVYILWPGFPFPLDPTVLAFTASATVTFLALWRLHIFDIVPVARASVFESMEDTILVLDRQGRLVDLNPAALNLIGHQAKEVIGQSVEQALGEYGPLVGRHCRSLEAGSQLVLGSGEAQRFFDLRVSRVRDLKGRTSGQLVALRDVTPRVRVEEALRASEEHQRALAAEAERRARDLALLNRVRVALYRELDLPTVFRTINEAIVETLGYTHVSLYLLEGTELVLQHQIGYERVIERIPVTQGVSGRVARSGEPSLIPDVRADTAFLGAVEGITSEICVPLMDQGRPVGILNVESVNGVVLGEADLRLMLLVAEQASVAISKARLYAEARANEALYRTLTETSPDAIIVMDPEARIIIANRCAVDLYGCTSAEELIGRDAITFIAPEERERAVAEWRKVLEQESVLHLDLTLVRQEGPRVPIEVSASAIPGHNGQPAGLICVARDASERKRTQEALQQAHDELELRVQERTAELAQANLDLQHEISEHRRTEEQLRQAQKMEAIGRLAGGVAHDFNNLLTVINGYGQIMLQRISPDSPLRHDMVEILAAGERAADLTRQLLAFSRRQVLQPRVLDLNDVFQGLGKIMQRLIGEDIHLNLQLAPGLGRVNVDPSQMEQVLFNLAVNARDAMPRGGTLTVTTANLQLGAAPDTPNAGQAHSLSVPPGPYVMLTVTDTGVGMSTEVLGHIFEPFFTTKEVGKGTGMGLATIYGIVRQSGGDIRVRSELGRGSTFEIVFPRVDAPAEALPQSESAPPQGKETILLVEDQSEVREVTARLLRTLGYHVLTASSGNEALELVSRTDENIALVLTDVVMPEMSGVELAEKLAAIRPQSKVLFMSGYTDGALGQHGLHSSEIFVVHKPLEYSSLAHKVRQVLDS